MGAGTYIGEKTHTISWLVWFDIGTAPCWADSFELAETKVRRESAGEISTLIMSAKDGAWALIAEYSSLVTVGSGTDNVHADSLVFEALTTDGSVGFPAPSS